MPRLLYITAQPAAEARNGRAMRTAMVLSALSELYDISVLRPEQDPPAGVRFDVVHVFRLAALHFAKPYLGSAARRDLDLDDIESKTHRRIEAIARSNGHHDIANWAVAESRRSEMLEVAAFRRFDRVYVCTEADRAELAPRSKAEVVVLPNAVHCPEPAVAARCRVAGEPFQFLLLGTMGYYPNFDGYHWFCREVLPMLRRIAPAPFVLNVAGSGSVERLRANESVRLLGEVSDVRLPYETADAVIVPLRAGGGTRIKILEAFSYQRPVVSTTIGAEGIEVASGTHILVGDSPSDFAARCADLMQDRNLANRLAGNAFRLVREAYSEEVLRRIVSSPTAAPSH